MPYWFIAGSLFCLGLSVWMFWNSFLAGPGTLEKPLYFQIIASLLFGLFGLWVGVSGRGIVPPAWYGLTQQRILMHSYKPHFILARFIESGRAVSVEKRGSHFNISIPVKPEHKRERGVEILERLSLADKERALAIINQTLGLRIQ